MMVSSTHIILGSTPAAKTTTFLSVVFFLLFFASPSFTQKRFSRVYPTGQNVRLQLMNRSGTVEVAGWDRSEISISASLESPAAAIVPQSINGTIVIDVVRANQGKYEVGNINFLVRVPYSTMVDIETRIGNLKVSNIQSGLVRAHISSEGDITLTNIYAGAVSAENLTGDIFFDGELSQGGNYRFSSMKGEINLRIPFESSFRLVATAPSTRNISLGPFATGNMTYLGDGRRVVGRNGDGSANLTVTNQQGGITFRRR
jgi:DUF4097 and DUF4098 domain-containing protein YvlB